MSKYILSIAPIVLLLGMLLNTNTARAQISEGLSCLSILKTTTSSIKIGWNDIAPKYKFEVIWHNGKKGEKETQGTVMNLIKLQPNTIYRFKVTALLSTGEEFISSGWKEAVTSPSPPVLPLGAGICINILRTTQDSIKIGWNDIAPKYKFEVVWHNGKKGEKETQSTIMNLRNLKPDTAYTFNVVRGDGVSYSGTVRTDSTKYKQKLETNQSGQNNLPTQLLGKINSDILSSISMTSHNGDLYIADQYESRILKVDLEKLGMGSIIEDFPDIAPSMTSNNGILYAVNSRGENELWQIDLNDMGNNLPIGYIPLRLGSYYGHRNAMASFGEFLFIAEKTDSGNGLWYVDLSVIGNSANSRGAFIDKLPFFLEPPNAMAFHNGDLYIAASLNSELWQIDTVNPRNSVPVGILPEGLESPSGMTSHNGSLYVVDRDDNELWILNPKDLDPVLPSGTGYEYRPNRNEPTHIVGNVPQDYTTGARLKWTGGTLYQLKARLQTLGCTADVIQVYDQEKEEWFLYTQYSGPHSLNREFHANYPDGEIPPTDIQIPNCYDICNFEYTDSISASISDYINQREDEGKWVPPDIGETCMTPEEKANSSSSSSDRELRNYDCNQDWDPRVIEEVFPIMPVMKDLCIFRTDSQPIYASRGLYIFMNPFFIEGNFWFSNYKPYVRIRGLKEREKAFFVELHEICHSQQEWYISQFMSPYELYTEDKTGLWNNTPAGQELIGAAKFSVALDDEGLSYWEELGPSSPYHGFYDISPLELGAELCAVKLYFKITGREDIELRDYPQGTVSNVLQAANQWLEDYVFVLE